MPITPFKRSFTQLQPIRRQPAKCPTQARSRVHITRHVRRRQRLLQLIATINIRLSRSIMTIIRHPKRTNRMNDARPLLTRTIRRLRIIVNNDRFINSPNDSIKTIIIDSRSINLKGANARTDSSPNRVLRLIMNKSRCRSPTRVNREQNRTKDLP